MRRKGEKTHERRDVKEKGKYESYLEESLVTTARERKRMRGKKRRKKKRCRRLEEGEAIKGGLGCCQGEKGHVCLLWYC